MADLSDKELKVLRALAAGSDRPQKLLAASAGLSETDFSRTKNELISKDVIRKFTIEIDYPKAGYPDIGVLFASVRDRQKAAQTAHDIRDTVPEAIAIFEVFGKDYDLVIKLMGKNNSQLREAEEKILRMENVRTGENTFMIIYSRVYKDTPGIPI